MAVPVDRGDAAIMLAGGTSVAKVAASLGVSRQCIYNWLGEAEFAAEVERVRDAVTSGAIGRLRGAVELAVGALCDVLTDEEAPAVAKVAAAREVLSRAGVAATTRIEVAVTEEEAIAWLATLPEPETLEPDPTH